MNNTLLRKQHKDYLRQIGQYLPFSNAEKKKIITKLKQGLQEYLSIFPDATMEDIYYEFGTCDEIILSFTKDSYILHNRRHSIEKPAIIACLLVLLLLIFRHNPSRNKNS